MSSQLVLEVLASLQPAPLPCLYGWVSVGFMAGPVYNIPFEILQQDTVFKLGSITMACAYERGKNELNSKDV